MAQIRKPPVTAKLYRHFAAVTIVLALGLAFIAGGNEGEEPVRSAAAAPNATATPAPRPAATPAYGQAQLVDSGGSGGFGSEAGIRTGGSVNRSRYMQPVVGTDLPPANSENAGFTMAYLNSLSDEELEALLQALRDAGITDDAERRRAAAVMEAASRRRSGQLPRQE
ncbi:hypothetical protein M3P36_09110 [Altererythrobacter sp. KTW20L]|uniref:hypothetical protein n=1 Tax=Altererythrobacter sp. KTW20L TaxID=2942210 RepID=UPI0020BEC4C0|nr:hypothetical protein [Altererythrobacter sp. KTW20L]MCL6251199.1 hypothetical protein [Altererythrobacter sp. KTW20L]